MRDAFWDSAGRDDLEQLAPEGGEFRTEAFSECQNRTRVDEDPLALSKPEIVLHHPAHQFLEPHVGSPIEYGARLRGVPRR